MKNTLDYYNQYAENFAAEMTGVDFSQIQEHFLSLLPEGARILDFGCGSGRDTKYFLEWGFQVEAVDGSGELCRLAGKYMGILAKKMLFQELGETEKYDGIWACASILHVKCEELSDVLARMCRAVSSTLPSSTGTSRGERNITMSWIWKASRG